MKAVAYNNEKTLIECKLVQFYSLRGQLLNIVSQSQNGIGRRFN